MSAAPRWSILNVRRLPGRLDVDQAATLLGFQRHDIPVLIRSKLLNPLGKPVQNATKWFASAVIQELAQDEKWLSKATVCISNHWKKKNK
jgi:hypothetical protein